MAEPELPTQADIAKLPRWARVAFAARCARRALELHLKHHPDAPPKWVAEISSALDTIEGFARQGCDPTQAAEDARNAFDAADLVAGQAFAAAHQAHFGANPETHPAFAAAQALQKIANGLREAYYEADQAAIEARREADSRSQKIGRGQEAGTARATAFAARAAARADYFRAAAEAIRRDGYGSEVRHNFSISDVFDAARRAVEAGVSTGSVVADFRLLVGIAARDGWYDATPVPPEVFEPTEPEAFPPWQEAFEAIRAFATPGAVVDTRRAEGAAMRERYPGEYVAYTEAADGRREVLVHDPSLKAVHAALAHLREPQIDAVRVTHCTAPATAFRGGYDGPPLTQEPPRV